MTTNKNNNNVKTYAKGTKQKVKSALVSRQKSHALIRNMVRIGISTISKVRHLWQDDLFSKVEYGGSDIHQLESAEIDGDGQIIIKNLEAFRLTQWLERGVFDAIEKEYLKSVRFAIQTKHPLSGDLITIEAYEFAISYESSDGTPATINGEPLTSNDGLKAQARRFLKTLYDFAATLDELPDDRCLSMMLKYHDNCPPEYEPEFFKSADAKALELNSQMHTTKLASVVASELSMQLSFSGLDSLGYADLVKVGSTGDILIETEKSLRNMSVGPTSILCASAMNIQGDEVSVGRGQETLEYQPTMHDDYENDNMQVESSPENEEIPLADQLQKYLLDNGESKTADILSNFNFEKKTIVAALSKLKKQGCTNNLRKGMWKITENVAVNDPPIPTPAAKAEEEVVVAPPAPRKKDRVTENLEVVVPPPAPRQDHVTENMEEEEPLPAGRRKNKRQERPVASPVVLANSPLLNDDSTPKSSNESEGAKRRKKYSIAIDSLHLLKGVNDGFQKSPSNNASQVHKLLFHD